MAETVPFSPQCIASNKPEERAREGGIPYLPSEEQYLFCIRCGLCLSVCPTYKESLRETDSPRARVMLVRKLVEGELPPSPSFTDHMYRCLDCLACNDICPVGIRPADLTLAMRAYLHRTQPQPWFKPLLFRGYFFRPGLMELSFLPLIFYQRSGLQDLVQRLGLTRLLPSQLRDLERLLPNPLPLLPLRRSIPRTTPAEGERLYRVGFFLGCFQSLVFAEGSRATVRVLARHGCEVVTPSQVRCCGMPHLGYGDMEALRALARHNIALFEKLDVEFIITDCATCGSTLKEYARYLADDPQFAARARAFSNRVRDINEFLGQIGIRKPDGSVPLRVTYHDPCHLRRGQGIWREPRHILEAAGAQLVEMEEPDACCGSAGTQLITHYRTSVGVLARKMEHIAATGAEVIATACPGCQLQLGLGLKRHGLQARVIHPVQLLDEAYRRGRS